jgi:hypothetical protein
MRAMLAVMADVVINDCTQHRCPAMSIWSPCEVRTRRPARSGASRSRTCAAFCAGTADMSNLDTNLTHASPPAEPAPAAGASSPSCRLFAASSQPEFLRAASKSATRIASVTLAPALTVGVPEAAAAQQPAKPSGPSSASGTATRI